MPDIEEGFGISKPITPQEVIIFDDKMSKLELFNRLYWLK